MTFLPGQVVSSEEWQRRHQFHQVVKEHEDFELSDGWVRRLYWRHCKTCDQKHLYKMENVQVSS